MRTLLLCELSSTQVYSGRKSSQISSSAVLSKLLDKIRRTVKLFIRMCVQYPPENHSRKFKNEEWHSDLEQNRWISLQNKDFNDKNEINDDSTLEWFFRVFVAIQDAKYRDSSSGFLLGLDANPARTSSNFPHQRHRVTFDWPSWVWNGKKVAKKPNKIPIMKSWKRSTEKASLRRAINGIKHRTEKG